MAFSFSSENQLQSIQKQYTKSLYICAWLYMENIHIYIPLQHSQLIYRERADTLQ